MYDCVYWILLKVNASLHIKGTGYVLFPIPVQEMHILLDVSQEAYGILWEANDDI